MTKEFRQQMAKQVKESAEKFKVNSSFDPHPRLTRGRAVSGRSESRL